MFRNKMKVDFKKDPGHKDDDTGPEGHGGGGE